MGLFNLFKKKENDYTFKCVVYINGMNCSHCSSSVENAFNSLEGVSAKVDLDKKCAFVSSNKELSDEMIKDTVEKTGFEFVKIER